MVLMVANTVAAVVVHQGILQDGAQLIIPAVPVPQAVFVLLVHLWVAAFLLQAQQTKLIQLIAAITFPKSSVGAAALEETEVVPEVMVAAVAVAVAALTPR
jgi:hypothetical protein